MNLKGAIRSIVETLKASDERLTIHIREGGRPFAILCELGASVRSRVYRGDGDEAPYVIEVASLRLGHSIVECQRQPARPATQEEIETLRDFGRDCGTVHTFAADLDR